MGPPAATLSALAGLLPEWAKALDETFRIIAGRLTDREATALRMFEAMGQRCLEELEPKTLSALKRAAEAAANDTIELREAASSRANTINETEHIYALFKQHDWNGNGMLDMDQFRKVLTELTGGVLTETEVDKITSSADKNDDSHIDLQEFSTWLAGGVAAQRVRRQSSVQSISSELDNAKKEVASQKRALEAQEEKFEEELQDVLEFWRSVAESSASRTPLNEAIDLSTKELLGNGKFGVVFKCEQRETQKPVVLKLMGLRWAHICVKEWQIGKDIGQHPSIVEYIDVMLHADDDESIEQFLKLASTSGQLKSRGKQARTVFPDRYIILLIEFMNRGTVQDWMDEGILTPGGMLVVMRDVATALAFMHSKGVTHNDIKPENILLSQEDDHGHGDPITVKLGDLGQARRDTDKTHDLNQYGMTVFCMATGEKFGARKFRTENAQDIAGELEGVLRQVFGSSHELGQAGTLAKANLALPDLLRRLWSHSVSMAELSKMNILKDWQFFDGVEEGEDLQSPQPIARRASTTDVRKMRHQSSRKYLS